MNQSIKQQISFLSEQLGIDVFLDDKQQAVLLIDGVYPVSIFLIDGVWRFPCNGLLCQ